MRSGTEVFESILFDLLHELTEARSPFVVGGAGEPLKEALLEFRRPTVLEVTDGFGHRDLLFLGRGGVHDFDGASHDVWSVEIGKKIGELDIFRAIVGGEVLIDLGDDGGLLLVGRRREADEDKGVGAEEIEAGLQVEFAVVELKK